MLSIQGDRFAVNGQQRFLVFITYFDALDVPDGQLDADLANLHDAVHLDGIRIFPNWWGQSSRTSGRFLTGNTVMDGAGNLRFDRWNKLLHVLDVARAHGLIVDVSWAKETVPVALPDYKSGLRTIAGMMAGSRFDHVLFDLQNEANNNGFGNEDIRQVVEAVRQGDSNRIITVSLDGNRTPGDASALAASTGQNVVAWHERRDRNWFATTASDVAALRAGGRPAFLQEPPKLEDDGGNIPASSFLEAARRAKEAGAAGWCYHTSAGQWMDPGTPLNPSGGIWDRITLAAADSNLTDNQVVVNVRGVVDNQPGPNSPPPPPPPSGGDVVFYEHINFGGASFSSAGDIFFVGWDWNDRISSIHIPPGRTIFIYQDWHYEGPVLQLTGDIPDLRNHGANDWISSVQIR